MLSINPINPNDNFYNETLDKLKIAGGKSNRGQAKLKAAAEAFESILVYQMFKSMNDNVIKSDLIEENQGEKIFKDFLLKTRSEDLAKNTKFGIAEIIYKQFSEYVTPAVDATTENNLPDNLADNPNKPNPVFDRSNNQFNFFSNHSTPNTPKPTLNTKT